MRVGYLEKHIRQQNQLKDVFFFNGARGHSISKKKIQGQEM